MEYYLFIGFILVVAGAGALLLVLSKYYKVKPGQLPYVQVPLLTEAERRFFSVLEEVLPKQYYLLTQVRLANLVHVKQGSGGFFWKQFSPIGMKCVDFVVVLHETMRPLVVIELDDSSHRFEDRRRRDAFVDQVLSSVGLPVLHWPAQRTYNKSELWHLIDLKIKEANL